METISVVKIEDLIANPDANYDWYNLTSEFIHNIPYEKFAETRHLKWDWVLISEKIKTIEHLENLNVLIGCPLNWKIISENMNEIIKRQIIFLDDLPEGYFVEDYFEEFLKYADLFPWKFSILTRGLPKVKIDKLALKIYGYTM